MKEIGKKIIKTELEKFVGIIQNKNMKEHLNIIIQMVLEPNTMKIKLKIYEGEFENGLYH